MKAKKEGIDKEQRKPNGSTAKEKEAAAANEGGGASFAAVVLKHPHSQDCTGMREPGRHSHGQVPSAPPGTGTTGQGANSVGGLHASAGPGLYDLVSISQVQPSPTQPSTKSAAGPRAQRSSLGWRDKLTRRRKRRPHSSARQPSITGELSCGCREKALDGSPESATFHLAGCPVVCDGEMSHPPWEGC